MRIYLLGLVQFGGGYGNPPTGLMAIAVLATLPVFLLLACGGYPPWLRTERRKDWLTRN
ncbi:MAG TPA: hypothetical protein VKI44_23200 [Acetobacteraceae bacterium]|nr:hypothetical protein [Acetobacteraceae bacterium]